MARGYMGKMLMVDLSKNKLKDEVLDEKLGRQFIGGYGIGTRIIFSRQKAGVDPLGPDNILGIVTGFTQLEFDRLHSIERVMGKVIHNLATIMSGARPTSLPIEIESEATNIRSYCFSLPSGDKLVALWTDGVAVDNDPGVKATVLLPGFSAQKVVGIDVLNGFEQELVTSIEDGNLAIENLLVRDYPLILHISKS